MAINSSRDNTRKSSWPFTIKLLGLLFLLSFVSLSLLAARMVASGSMIWWFLAWNLVLAWLPLLFALGLRLNLTKKRWSHWQNIGLSFLWLGFLPNSFYIISDYIHLYSEQDVFLLLDIALMTSFVINGLILGFLSIFIVHRCLLKRFANKVVTPIIGLVFFACGFAIYIGRFLRWNTWDVIMNPAALLFDLSERVINPVTHAETYLITFVFGVVLASTYAVIYELIKLINRSSK